MSSTRTASRPARSAASCRSGVRMGARSYGTARLRKTRTQAVAADLLRLAVTRIETNPALAFMPIRMTTHDEIVCRGRRGARRGGESDPAARNADPAGLGRGPAAAVRGKRLPLVHQSEGGAAMNAPFPSRVLRSYQQRAATFLYERDAAFLIAPLGAGKGAAALTALAELIRDGHRRHALVIAPKLVATTVWPQEVASWPHLAHLRVAVLDGQPRAPARAARRGVRRAT